MYVLHNDSEKYQAHGVRVSPRACSLHSASPMKPRDPIDIDRSAPPPELSLLSSSSQASSSAVSASAS